MDGSVYVLVTAENGLTLLSVSVTILDEIGGCYGSGCHEIGRE
ncbi:MULTISPECIES: hypothetical protein [Shewanella]|nr:MULTISPECIES: hypothetical protein [Shewanella]